MLMDLSLVWKPKLGLLPTSNIMSGLLNVQSKTKSGEMDISVTPLSKLEESSSLDTNHGITSVANT